MKRLLVVIAASGISTAGAAFKCVDAKGITHVGDTPPPGCASVMMYEVTPSGKVLREIEPTLTPEQARVRAIEMEKKRELDKVAAEQKRKDAALLSTYSSEKEFDVARDRNVEPVKTRIAATQERIGAVDKRQKEIQEEMEFYKAGKAKKAGEMPSNLTVDLKRIEAERITLVTSIATSEKEIQDIKTKFDADKKRWIDLKAGDKKSVPTATSASPTDAKAAVNKN
jgi:hypothetical protein